VAETPSEQEKSTLEKQNQVQLNEVREK